MNIDFRIYRLSDFAKEHILYTLLSNDTHSIAESLPCCLKVTIGGLPIEDEDSIIYVYRNVVECIELLENEGSGVFLVGQSPPSITFSPVDRAMSAVNINSYGSIIASELISTEYLIEEFRLIRDKIRKFLGTFSSEYFEEWLETR